MGGRKEENMKKIFASIALLALAFTATPAFAHDGDGGDHKGSFRASVKTALENRGWHWGQNQFVAMGTVASVSGSNLTVNVQSSSKLGNIERGAQVVFATNSETKFFGSDKTVLALADIKVGDKVIASGSVEASVYTASTIWDKTRPVTKAYGTVTAKTDDSVTITNSVTGQSQTVAVNGDTNIAINGETKTAADISVGDVGWVKFKNTAGDLVAKLIRLFR